MYMRGCFGADGTYVSGRCTRAYSRAVVSPPRKARVRPSSHQAVLRWSAIAVSIDELIATVARQRHIDPPSFAVTELDLRIWRPTARTPDWCQPTARWVASPTSPGSEKRSASGSLPALQNRFVLAVTRARPAKVGSPSMRPPRCYSKEMSPSV